MANEATAALREERRELLAALQALAVTGAGTSEGLEAGSRLQANIAAETAHHNTFQAR